MWTGEAEANDERGAVNYYFTGLVRKKGLEGTKTQKPLRRKFLCVRIEISRCAVMTNLKMSRSVGMAGKRSRLCLMLSKFPN